MYNFQYNQNPHNEDKYNQNGNKSSNFTSGNRSNSTKVIVAVIIAVLSLIIVLGACIGCYIGGKNSALNDNMKEDLAVANEVYSLIKDYYYMDISKDEFNKWASIGLANTMDKYSNLYLSNAAPSMQFGISIKSDAYDNHIITEISHSSNSSYPTPAEEVLGTIEGSTEQVHLERGDILISVDGKSVVGLNTDILNSEQFLGKAGVLDSIELVVKKSNGKLAKFRLKKSVFNTKEASYLNIGNGIGYIKLNSFTGTAANDFKECVKLFKENGNKKLIFDLRDNGGGSTDILSVIASYIIHDNNGKSNGLGIIKLESKKTQEISTYTAKGNNWLGLNSDGSINSDYKLAVLVNENSASASEALLGAIKYYCGEATIIGSPTYGKGIAQQTFELNSTKDFVLSMTIGYFYVPVEGGKWVCYHGQSMMPSEEQYTIEKFSNVLDFTANDSDGKVIYPNYYNNDITKEKAMILAMSVLNK